MDQVRIAVPVARRPRAAQAVPGSLQMPLARVALPRAALSRAVWAVAAFIRVQAVVQAASPAEAGTAVLEQAASPAEAGTAGSMVLEQAAAGPEAPMQAWRVRAAGTRLAGAVSTAG
jgi:hypothetical protein